jgi:ubiquinone/menaquinone biosynthesis C-methylase UbiE
MEKQVDKKHYGFKKYCFPDRWASYWYQLDEILKLKPQSVLEVGAGDRVIANYLQDNAGIAYTSVDIAADLEPDIVSSVDDLKINDNSFDLVACFEVLEHLPFEKFIKSLQELHRVSKHYVIISLPHWGRHFPLSLRLPGFKRIRLQSKINLWPIKHKFRGQHYWEIGKKNYPIKLIRKHIKQTGFEIIKDYIAFDSPYHHFFVLKK